jgi:hypothetical protein
MDNFGLFVFGNVVFIVVLVAAFAALIGSDRPEQREQSGQPRNPRRKAETPNTRTDGGLAPTSRQQ